MNAAGSHQVVIIAPTPAPYRAFEYDLVAERLAGQYQFRAFFLERRWEAMNWRDDLPGRMAWEVLPPARAPAWLRGIPGCRRLNRGLVGRLNELDPAAIIVHGYDSPTLWVAYLWAFRRRRAVLFRSDSNVANETRSDKSRIWLHAKRFCLRRLFSRVNAFLTTGIANEEYYSFYGADPARYFRTCFTVDADRFARLASAERQAGRPLKRDLGIRQARVVLCPGRLVWRKDPRTVLRAFAALRQRRCACDAALLFVGDGPDHPALEELARPLSDCVYFTGFRQPDEVARLYGIADLAVLASVYEPYGLVVNEAMAAGLPVIASDRVGSARDLVVAGATGEFFPAGDAEALAGHMERILGDDETAGRMGRAGAAHLADWHRRYDIADGYAAALNASLRM